MHLLVLGGTQFVGRTIVETALARGHSLTLFNRGQRNPGLFPEVEHVRGDRNSGLDALRDRQWDAVIDTCGYLSRLVQASAELLVGSVERYVFISTISVYAHFRTPGLDETAELGTLADSSSEEITSESYGPLKVLCEQAVEAAFPEQALIIRPGLIIGPYDPTDRFTYWVARAQRGGDMLVPNAPDMHSQLIDVRDLATWILAMVEAKHTGVFNATGPKQPYTLREVIETCQSVTGSGAQPVWVEEAWLLEQGVQPWSELPLWLPTSTDPDMAGFGDVSVARAIQAGLRFRTLEATMRDTLAWAASRPSDHQWRAGLTPEREAELLRAWYAEPNKGAQQ